MKAVTWLPGAWGREGYAVEVVVGGKRYAMYWTPSPFTPANELPRLRALCMRHIWREVGKQAGILSKGGGHTCGRLTVVRAGWAT